MLAVLLVFCTCCCKLHECCCESTYTPLLVLHTLSEGGASHGTHKQSPAALPQRQQHYLLVTICISYTQVPTLFAKSLPSMLSKAMSMSLDSLPSSLSLTHPPAARRTVFVPANCAAAIRMSNSSLSSLVRVILSCTIAPTAVRCDALLVNALGVTVGALSDCTRCKTLQGLSDPRCRQVRRAAVCRQCQRCDCTAADMAIWQPSGPCASGKHW